MVRRKENTGASNEVRRQAILRVGNNWLGGGAMTFCGVQNSGDFRGRRGAKHVAVVYSANFGKLYDSRF